MRQVSIRDVRSHLAALLNEVCAGQSVAITRRGQEVARLVPTAQALPALPSRSEQRRSMLPRGTRAKRSAVVRMRDEERA
jgi:prevent-host-death family protein